MTRLDNILLKNIEKYELHNNHLPILMQKYPWLTEVAYNAILKNINLLMIDEPSDYVYFILATIAKESTIELSEIGMRNFVDPLTFFEILENYLIHIFEIKKAESAIIRSKRKNKDIKIIQKDIILNILKKFDIKDDFFALLNIKNHNKKISFTNVSRLISYTNLIFNEWNKN